MIQTYFSDPVAPANSDLVVAGLIASGVILALGLVMPLLLHIFRGRPKPVWSLWRSLAAVARLAGFVFLLLLFLRYQALQPFNYRAWVFIALLPFIVWVIVIIRRYRATKPAVKVEAELEDRFHKYLPQKKR